MGNLTSLLNKIRPAVADVAGAGAPSSADTDLVERVAERNVQLVVEEMPQRSLILAEMLDAGEIAIVGGMYDVGNGVVSFVDEAAADD